MALTQLSKIELNKRVDKILHAPSNAPVSGLQLEISFVADMTGDREYIDSSIKDAVTALKSHDKIFQNVRSNMVYWSGDKISMKPVPMTFIQMGKAFEDCDSENADKAPDFGKLCAYLKLYNARSRIVLVFVDCDYEKLPENNYFVTDAKNALDGLNPFLKYRLLIIVRDKMITGSEIMMKLIS